MINTSKIYKMRVVFCVSENGPKRQDTLDTMRNIIVHSGLDYTPAKINKRWPRLSYGPLVGRGQIARREYIDIYLKTSVLPQQVCKQLNDASPQGVSVLEVQRVPYALASLQQLATAAVYTIEGDFVNYTPQQTIEDWITADSIEVVEQASNGIRLTTNIRPFIRSARSLGEYKIELTLSPVAEKWINPLVYVYAWLGINIIGPLAELTDERFKVIREGLYWQDSLGNLYLI